MREATQKDLPRGKEAQCPMCWRLFGGDRAAESHKDYRGLAPRCVSPAGKGLLATEKRGLAVWSRPAPEAFRKVVG